MSNPTHPHEEPGLSPLEFARLRDELRKSNEELAAANAALRESERRLEQRVVERTRELSTLLQVLQNITTTLDLEPLLGSILDQLGNVVSYRLASISALENDVLVLLEQRGSESPMLLEREDLNDHPYTRKMLYSGEPIIIPDLHADAFFAERVRNNIVKRGQETVYVGSNSWMSVPLIARNKPVGVLILTHEEVNYYTPARAELVMAFANYAAIAIENARLYRQAGVLAALEERQKLARDLHDSVSQALYGIVLGAHTARALLEEDPAKAVEPIEYILSLAEAGLAEMRALIFELRPESLQTDGLVAALQRLVNALGSRHQLKVQLEAGEEPEISIALKESLYRIAQEAMNNIAKHANASEAEIKLQAEDGQLILAILDNGIGFDTNQKFPGHLGLQSMSERVARSGGTFTLESAPGHGTQIRVKIPLT